MNKIIRLYESPGKRRRRSVYKSHWDRSRGCDREWNQSAGHVHGKPVGVVAIHKDAVHIQVAIVEIEVSASSIKWLTYCQNHWRRCCIFAGKALHRTSVERECTKTDVRVIARTCRTRSLHRVTACLVLLQVEAV